MLGAHAGRAHVAAGAGGDVTFAIDSERGGRARGFLAERAPERRLLLARTAGWSNPAGRPRTWVLVVDPIDGTRPALAGFESACVSVAAAPLGDGEPTMGDVEVGAIVEIKSGARVPRACAAAACGRDRAGARLSARTPSARADVLDLGFRGRPARPTVEVLGELIDGSSVGGATFELGSAASTSRACVTGQLDAYLELGPRLIEEVPALRAALRAGRGRPRPQQLALRPRGRGAAAARRPARS